MDSDIAASTKDRTNDPVWGEPHAGRPWTTRQTLTALGVAAVIAAFGGAAIYAATSGSDNAGPGKHGPGPGRWGPGGPSGSDGPAAALHGEFVVPDGNGGYQTELTQTGVVTSVSAASITAKSDDGFTQAYTLGPAAANPQPALDDTVTIRATLTNGTATATSITEGSDQGPGPRPFGPPR